MSILAIDQGTSGTKAILLDDDFQVIKKGYAPLDTQHNQNGAAQTTADLLWQSVVDAINQVITTGNHKIVAIALANQGESILAWDRQNGQALTPVIIWQDSRSSTLCEERKEHSQFVLSKTGLTIDPYFVAPKITWLKQNYPKLPKSAFITTTDTYLIYKLTGEFVTDKATASRSLLFDLANLSWQQQLADIWGIDISTLPKLVDNDQIIGQVCAKEFPQLKATPLAAAIVDQPAALFAQNCFTSGQAKCTFGTGAFLLTNIADQIKISKNGLATSLAWQIKQSTNYYLDGQVFTAASCVDWLLENNFINKLSEIDQLPDANGVIACPSFAGLGAPLWRADATASIMGLGLNHNKSHIASAIIDGIAAAVADLLSAVKSDGVAITTLRVDGGLTQSTKLMQMQADLAQIPVEQYAHPDATAMGVAYLAALALNPNLSIADIAKRWQPAKVYLPKIGSDQAHNYLSRWRGVQRVSLDRGK
jgi:glycerol kinase